MINLEDVMKLIEGNKRILIFLGSGFSVGVMNHNDESLPTGGQLANRVYAECDIPNGDGDLQFASEKYIKKHSVNDLLVYIKNSFTISTMNPYYDSYSIQDWFRVYTTNYDDLFENISRKNKKVCHSASIENDISSFRNKSDLVIHLNGYINNLTQGNIHNFFKLTGSSYLTDTITSSTWYEQIKADVKVADILLFIGYSVDSDLDIKRLFFSNDQIKSKTVFIVWDKEKELNIEKLERYGQVCSSGVEAFSKKLGTIKITNVKFDEKALTCFEQKIFSSNLKDRIKDTDVFDLLFWGKINKEYINQSISSENSDYVFQRNFLKEIKEAFNANYIPVIHSNMGNGKSVYINILSYQLSKEGFSVFLFRKPYQNIDEEIDYISKLKGKIVIIIDRYNLYYHITKKIISQLGSRDINFVLSERTNIYDVTINNLEYALNFDHIGIDINRLDSNEVLGLIRLVNLYSFWGDHAALSDVQKVTYLTKTCKRQLSLFLIDAINSRDMKNRLDLIIKKISSDDSGFKLFILLLISDVIGLNPDIDDLQGLIGYKADIGMLRQDSDYKEVFDFTTGQVKLKSSILAQCLIEMLESNELLFSTIYNAAKVAERVNTSFSSLFVKELTMYNNVEKIFRNKNQHRKHIIDFYILAKDFFSCRENPLFWLQYSIAMIALNELDQADTYLKNAYAYADSIGGYNTFQIDNQYGRLLMEQCLRDETENHFDILQKVHLIITDPKQMRDNRHYPFRVGIKYADYYRKYYHSLSQPEKDIFKDNCQELYSLAIYSKANSGNEITKRKIDDFIRIIELVLGRIIPNFNSK